MKSAFETKLATILARETSVLDPIDAPALAATIAAELEASRGPVWSEIAAAVHGVMEARKGVLADPTGDNVGNQWGNYVTKVEVLLRTLSAFGDVPAPARGFQLTLVDAVAFRGVHEALQQYLDNQVELDPGEAPTPYTVAVQKLVDVLDAVVQQLAEEPKGGAS